MPKTIIQPIKTSKMYFGIASTTDDFIKHKRIVGETELKQNLQLLFFGFIIGLIIGVFSGFMLSML